jgi:predicted O-linked N-acetylglucosamine transferase (SPINDLY family)
MALYSLADVVLDSYHAGGCTTTREALEVGALVVTLPAKYLGSRWSAAYYTIMGVTESEPEPEPEPELSP